ncbi:MAG: hypothetical protein K5650_05360 [Bacteroidales bacterium]|nr:hypothetical protein [Bacteroidales bacterium]
MENLIEVPDIPPTDDKNGFWKNLLYIVLGTTISILLTFGTSQWMAQQKQKEERHLTALMVMGNIEKFASSLENCSEKMYVRDTFATYLLGAPIDSLGLPKYGDILDDLLSVSYTLLVHDQSVEKVFSNSIDTWKNMGNFQFIEGVGKVFSQMEYWESLHNGLREEIQESINTIKKNPDAYPGKTLDEKLLRDPNFRRILQRHHIIAIQERYAADHLRYINRYHMKLMDISEEEVMEFAHRDEDNVEAVVGEPKKKINEFVTPELNIDSLPDYQTWFKQHQW